MDPARQGSVSAPANLCAVRVPALPIVAVLVVELLTPPALRGSLASPPVASSVVADGASEDATASNNQVKLIRDPSGALLAAYVSIVAHVPQIALVRSRDGGRHWTALAQASGGTIPSRLPALGLDGGGRLHVVWTRYDDGVGKIYHRVWQDHWTSEPERISPRPGYAGFPGLALDAGGRPHVVWYGIRAGSLPAASKHGSIYEIFYTGFDGRAWSPPLLISTGMPDAVNPALAADRAGRLYAVWYQFDARAYQVRYAERRAAWSEPETVLATRADAFNPDLAVGARGEVVVAWEHHDGQASVVQVSRRSTGRWSDPLDLSAASSRARHPSVSIAPSGAVYVTWDTDDGQVFVDRFTTRWEPAFRLTGDGGNTYPSVAAEEDGADVIWTHTAQGGSSVRYLRRGPEGSSTAPPASARVVVGGAVVILLALVTLARLRSRRLRAKAA
jgi:hypothetical protein